MTEYLLVWEYYDASWNLSQKGNYILRVTEEYSFEDGINEYCEYKAESFNAPRERVVISYCTKI